MSKNSLNEQQRFWVDEYADDYIAKNSEFDEELGLKAWKTMLAKAEPVNSILECGCNIGRNIKFLDRVIPQAEKSIIEINKLAFEFVTSHHRIKYSFNGPIVQSGFDSESFDLTFSCGVLIHIHPDDIIANMSMLYKYSRKYVLIAEYFSRTPVMIEYQGQQNKLFKRDFGKLFIENFDVKVTDYGFLWGYIYDKAGFDDITWWLFEKK